MTAMDVFVRYADNRKAVARLEEKIERRRALATGDGSPRLSPDGGSRGSGDASMRLLDYVANVDELLDERNKAQKQMDADRACCVYLAETLDDNYAGVMLRCWLEGMGLKQVADDMGYSVSSIKRIKRAAEELLARIEILYWDGVNVPVLSVG